MFKARLPHVSEVWNDLFREHVLKPTLRARPAAGFTKRMFSSSVLVGNSSLIDVRFCESC